MLDLAQVTPPGTAAADAHDPRALGRLERRRRLLGHAARSALVAAVVFGVFAGISVHLGTVGRKECVVDDDDGGAEVCVERLWWPLTVQLRSEVWTKNGVHHGPRVEWHKNGAVWVQGAYENGVRVGPWLEGWSTGAPRFRGTYQADVLEGSESWFFADGSLEWTAERRGGKREGVERWYWPNGTLRREGSWKAGEKHGRFASFNEDGVPALVTEFVDGAQR